MLPPDEWIYQYYLNIPPLHGQDIKIKSLFNVEDDTPSMFVFYSRLNNRYKWKCHSSGLGGNAITLVRRLFGLNKEQAISKIVNDYKSSGGVFQPIEYSPQPKWELESYALRDLNTNDLGQWGKFGISKDALLFYNVKPIKEFVLKKQDREMIINDSLIYGYFDKNGELYKIYTPHRKKKFFKVKSYVQGLDQVKEGDKMIALSSLKDVMSFFCLGFKGWKGVAPDSENTPLPLDVKIEFTLFDNDNAGYKSMLKYYQERNTPFIVLRGSKDLSDNIRDGNINYVIDSLNRYLKN